MKTKANCKTKRKPPGAAACSGTRNAVSLWDEANGQKGARMELIMLLIGTVLAIGVGFWLLLFGLAFVVEAIGFAIMLPVRIVHGVGALIRMTGSALVGGGAFAVQKGRAPRAAFRDGLTWLKGQMWL